MSLLWFCLTKSLTTHQLTNLAAFGPQIIALNFDVFYFFMFHQVLRIKNSDSFVLVNLRMPLCKFWFSTKTEKRTRILHSVYVTDSNALQGYDVSLFHNTICLLSFQYCVLGDMILCAFVLGRRRRSRPSWVQV